MKDDDDFFVMAPRHQRYLVDGLSLTSYLFQNPTSNSNDLLKDRTEFNLPTDFERKNFFSDNNLSSCQLFDVWLREDPTPHYINDLKVFFEKYKFFNNIALQKILQSKYFFSQKDHFESRIDIMLGEVDYSIPLYKGKFDINSNNNKIRVLLIYLIIFKSKFPDLYRIYDGNVPFPSTRKFILELTLETLYLLSGFRLDKAELRKTLKNSFQEI